MVTVIIIITHGTCFSLLFLIGGEDSATTPFYSKEIFFCLFCIYLERKNQPQKQNKNTEMKHVIGETLHSFNLKGARVPGMGLAECWLS